MALASLAPIALIVATFGAFFARRELWDAMTLAGILANEMVAQTLKRIFAHPRPPSCARVDFCGTHGMPSSHAQLATFAATLATARRRRRRLPPSRRGVGGERERETPAAVPPPGGCAERDLLDEAAVAASWIVAVAVAESRVYLGYHSLDQVLAGSAVGLIVGAAWARVCAWASDAFAPVLARAAAGAAKGGRGGPPGGFGSGGAKSLAEGFASDYAARFARGAALRDTSSEPNPMAVVGRGATRPRG